MENYSFSAGSVTVLKANVFLIEYNKIDSITVRNVYDLVKLINNLVGHHPFHTISDFTGGLFNLTSEAKSFLADLEHKEYQHLSDSILVDSLAKRIETEFYLTFHRPKVKTKVFNDLNKALNWIEFQEKTINKDDLEIA